MSQPLLSVNGLMMRFGGLTANEQWMRGEVSKLIALRRSSMPLLYGDYRLLYVDDSAMVYERSYLGEVVTVGLNNGSAPAHVEAGGVLIDIEPYGYVIDSSTR